MILKINLSIKQTKNIIVITNIIKKLVFFIELKKSYDKETKSYV